MRQSREGQHFSVVHGELDLVALKRATLAEGPTQPEKGSGL
ncbi:hypothetical protein [Microvirga massiliensis]|nr:hypothetical protein [Microvirga massiliensis]